MTPRGPLPLSPSDLEQVSATPAASAASAAPALSVASAALAASATPDRAIVAGRVSAVSTTSFQLADAFATASIAMDDVSTQPDIEVGDLVVVAIARRGDGLRLERVLERYRPSGPRSGASAASASSTATAPSSEHQRLIGGVGANLVARGKLFAHIRGQFAEWGFVEVDTPALVPSPGLDLHLDAVPADGAWLATSPEYQMKRLLVGGVPRLFQIGHVYRKGEIGARHNPEFTMLEWYRAFAGMDAVMNDTEALVAGAVKALAGAGRAYGAGVGDGARRADAATTTRRLDMSPPFERIPVAEAFARYARVAPDEALSLAAHDEEQFFRLLVDRVEPALAELGRPVFLTEYPISQASLARASPADPRVCERFELYAGGVELCNGFGELTDPIEQRRRFEHDQQERAAIGKAVPSVDTRFLAALDEGMPPSAGNALGVDRLLALCLGESDIARVMPFPSGWL